MANARAENAVRQAFAPGSQVQANLSGAPFSGDGLWVAGDEAHGLDRPRRLDPMRREVLRFGDVRDFPLADLLDLPGLAEEDADLEGVAVAEGLLWVAGSYGTHAPGRQTRARPPRQRQTAGQGGAGRQAGPLARLPLELDTSG